MILVVAHSFPPLHLALIDPDYHHVRRMDRSLFIFACLTMLPLTLLEVYVVIL